MTVQMTIEQDLIAEVDRAVRRLKTTRSALTSQALRDALQRLAVQQQEARHRRGYASHPVRAGEFDVWSKEQVWPE